MTDAVQGLYNDAIALIDRFGKCVAKDPECDARKDWNKISLAVKVICDDTAELSAAEDIYKEYMKTIEKYTECTTGFNCEEMLQKYEDDMKNSCTNLQSGINNEMYSNLKYSMLGEDSNNYDETEIHALSQNIPLIDPLTKLPLTDPVKNVICGHVYEKETIMLLLDSKKTIKCPIPGCVAASNVRKDDLVPDEALKEQLEKNQ